MDIAIIISIVALAINVVVGLAILAGFLWRIPTKDDIKRVEDKVDDNTKQLQTVSGDVRRLEGRMETLETRMETLETRMETLETRMGTLETRMGTLETRMGNMESSLEKQEDSSTSLEAKVETSLEQHHKTRGDLMVLQASVNRLESYFETPKLKSS